MKLKITITFLFLSFSLISLSQSIEHDNFYKYIEQKRSLVVNDTAEGGLGKKLERLNKIWGERLSPHGNYRIAAKAIHNYAVSYDSKSFKSNTRNNTIPINWQCIGPTGNPNGIYGNGIMHAITFDPDYDGVTNKTVYAASNFGGLWRSEIGGGEWENVNTDFLPMTTVSDIAINPNNSNQIFIATGNADSGVAYQSSPNTGNVNPLYTIGVYRSLDYGATWHPINDGLYADFSVNGGVIRRIIINPDNPNEIFVASTEGIYRTQNGLAANPVWTKLFHGSQIAPDREFKGLEFKPDTPTTLFASGKDVYKSTDSGITWANITGPATGLDLNAIPNYDLHRINIAVTPANPNLIYTYIVGYDSTQVPNPNPTPTNPNATKDKGAVAFIYSYSDVTHQWTFLYDEVTADAFNQVDRDRMAIAASPFNANEFYFGTTYVIGTRDIASNNIDYKSPYNGSGYHADVHALEFDPIDPDQLFCAHDGGISVKDLTNQGNGGWTYKNSGLQVATIWSFDDYEFDKDVIISAFQDNGTSVVKLDANNDRYWKLIAHGDGYAAQIDNQNKDNAFFAASSSFRGYNYTTGSSNHQSSLLPYDTEDPTKKAWMPITFPVENHPYTGDMYFGFTEIYKRLRNTFFQGQTPNDFWEASSNLGKVRPALWQRQITEYEISEADPDVQYLAVGGANFSNGTQYEPLLMKTEVGGCLGNYNASNCFFDITDNLRTSTGMNDLPTITDVELHPGDSDKLWVSFTGFLPTIKVWYSEDGGNTWNNADPNGDLANLPVNNIVFQDGTYDTLYAATDAGIYVKEGNNWSKYGDFPNVRVTELKINYCARKLRAATYGRSLWEGNLKPYSGYLADGKVVSADETFQDIYIEKNLKISEGITSEIVGELNVVPKTKIAVGLNGNLQFDGSKINYCSVSCSELFFDVQGTLKIDNGLDLHTGSKINIGANGRLEINGDFCFNEDFEATIDVGGAFIINGQDYTSVFTNGLPYNLSFVNQNISGNYYAYNRISTFGTVTNNGTTILKAGREVLFKKGFLAQPNFLATIDGVINNCDVNNCTVSDLLEGRSYDITKKIIKKPKKEKKVENIIEIELYPNPTKNGQNVSIVSREFNIDDITIYNSIGVEMPIRLHKINDLHVECNLNSSLTSGLYLVKITVNNQAIFKRLIIE